MPLFGKTKLNKMDFQRNYERQNADEQAQRNERQNDEEEPRSKRIEFLRELNQWAIENEHTPLINQENRWDMPAISELFEYIIELNNENDEKRNYYKSRLDSLREKYNELVRYINETGNDEAYQKWKQAQKQGRPKKTIDWERYDLLVRAQLNQKEIAQHLGVSTNTLRKLLKER